MESFCCVISTVGYMESALMFDLQTLTNNLIGFLTLVWGILLIWTNTLM